MSGNLRMFVDKLDDEDIEILKHEFITSAGNARPARHTLAGKKEACGGTARGIECLELTVQGYSS